MTTHHSIKRPFDVKSVIIVILEYKSLTELPEWIEECSSLEELYCANNKLTFLPPNLPDSIEILDCSDNHITNLPISLPSSLKELNCSDNKLTCLPLSLPDSLTELNCNDNKLTTLTLTLPNSLQILYCSYNQLTSLPSTLPSSLQVLFCANNKLTSLPLTIIQNRNLTAFCYSGNPIENIHPIIVRFLDRLITLKSIYEDQESVHNHTIQESIRKSIFNVLSDDVSNTKRKDVIKEIINDSILSVEVKEALFEYSKDQTIHSTLSITFMDLLIPVWERIKTKDEIKKVLNIEMQDSICKCFTGRLSRLVNCLNGFFDDVSVKISDSDQIGNVIILTKKKLEDEGKYSVETHIEIVRKELTEREFDDKVIEEWIEYID